MLRTGHAPVACQAPLPVAAYRKRRGVDAAAAPALASAPLALLGLHRFLWCRTLAGAALPPSLRARRDIRLGVAVYAAPSRVVCQPRAALQPARRSTALAATAAGENELERHGSFFNRKAELQSLAALLSEPPSAVLVMTGPPSCGKSGARLSR